MSNKRLKITGVADFSSLKREISGLNKVVHDAIGDGVQIFDEDSIVLMKREVASAFGKMRTEISKLTKEGKELQKQFHSATGDAKKQEVLSKKQLDNAKLRVKAEKELFRLKQTQNTLDTGTTPEQKKALENQRRKQSKEDGNQRAAKVHKRGRVLGRAAGAFVGAASPLPGAGEVAEVGGGVMSMAGAASAAGLGAVATGGLVVLAAAAAGAAVSISRMASGFDVYKQGIGDLLKLSGMGVKHLGHDERTVSGARELGFDKLQVLALQSQMAGAFGKGRGRQDSNRMLNILTASRGMGVDPGSILGGADQLRMAGGTDSAQKQIGLIIEKAFTSGMDRTQASSFLNAAVGLLTEINQSGVANSNAMLGVMAGLVAKKAMSAEQAAKSLAGMSGAIAGSSGESNAFFQTAAVRAGLGGGTLLGTEFATRQGLVGVDMKALGNQVGDSPMGRLGMRTISDMGLGDSQFTQRYAGGILNEIKRRFPTMDASKNSRGAAMGFTGQMFGVKKAEEITKIWSLLEKLSSGKGTTADEKKFGDYLNADPQESWRTGVLSDLDSIARATSASQAGLKNAQFDLGESSAPIFNKLIDALASLDNTLNKLVSGRSDSIFDPMKATIEDFNKGMADFIKPLVDFAQNPMEGIRKLLLGDDSGSGKDRAEMNDKLHSLVGVSFAEDGGIRVDPSFKQRPLTVDEQKEARDLTGKLGGKNLLATPGSPDASATAGHGIIGSDLLNETKKQTQLLEKLTRPGAAPRGGRETSRP